MENNSIDEARTNAIQKVYEKIAETGMVTQNQLCFLSLFIKKKDPTEVLINEAKKLFEGSGGGETK